VAVSLTGWCPGGPGGLCRAGAATHACVMTSDPAVTAAHRAAAEAAYQRAMAAAQTGVALDPHVEAAQGALQLLRGGS
jgi:hypothetical protein